MLKLAYINKDKKIIEKIHEEEKSIIYKKAYSLINCGRAPTIETIFIFNPHIA